MYQRQHRARARQSIAEITVGLSKMEHGQQNKEKGRGASHYIKLKDKQLFSKTPVNIYVKSLQNI
jgi:hypothetical protein